MGHYKIIKGIIILLVIYQVIKHIIYIVLDIPLFYHYIDIPEQHVGVRYRFNSLKSEIYYPGRNFLPAFSDIHTVFVNLETVTVNDVLCGTRDGIMVTFDTIEVVNQVEIKSLIGIVRNFGIDYRKILIFDRIHHEVNKICSTHTLEEIYITKFSNIDEELINSLRAFIEKYTKGLRIINLRLSKPTIPISIKEKYEKKSRVEVDKKIIYETLENERINNNIQLENSQMKHSISLLQEKLYSKTFLTLQLIKALQTKTIYYDLGNLKDFIPQILNNL